MCSTKIPDAPRPPAPQPPQPIEMAKTLKPGKARMRRPAGDGSGSSDVLSQLRIPLMIPTE